MRMLIRRVYVRPGRGVAALLVAVATFAAGTTFAIRAAAVDVRPSDLAPSLRARADLIAFLKAL